MKLVNYTTVFNSSHKKTSVRSSSLSTEVNHQLYRFIGQLFLKTCLISSLKFHNVQEL